MSAAGKIKKRGLATVRITDKGYADGMMVAMGHGTQLVRITVLQRQRLHCRGIGPSSCLRLSNDFYHGGLIMPKTDLIPHQPVFYRVMQRGIEQHLNLLA